MENARQEIDATGQIFILPDFPPKASPDLHWLDSLPAEHRGFPQHVQSMAELTKMRASAERQTNESLPDVCNANLRNTELTGEADARVALPIQAGDAAKPVAEAGAWYFDAASLRVR